jgi:hypothetical protein
LTVSHLLGHLMPVVYRSLIGLTVVLGQTGAATIAWAPDAIADRVTVELQRLGYALQAEALALTSEPDGTWTLTLRAFGQVRQQTGLDLSPDEEIAAVQVREATVNLLGPFEIPTGPPPAAEAGTVEAPRARAPPLGPRSFFFGLRGSGGPGVAGGGGRFRGVGTYLGGLLFGLRFEQLELGLEAGAASSSLGLVEAGTTWLVAFQGSAFGTWRFRWTRHFDVPVRARLGIHVMEANIDGFGQELLRDPGDKSAAAIVGLGTGLGFRPTNRVLLELAGPELMLLWEDAFVPFLTLGARVRFDVPF